MGILDALLRMLGLGKSSAAGPRSASVADAAVANEMFQAAGGSLPINDCMYLAVFLDNLASIAEDPSLARLTAAVTVRFPKLSAEQATLVA